MKVHLLSQNSILVLPVIAIILLLQADLRADSAPNSTASQQVPTVMYDFLGGFLLLQPYMVSPKKFADPKNEEKISQHLSDLSKNSKRLSHGERLDTASFQISAQLLQEHLTGIRDLFNQGRKDYARRMLNSTLDGCSSCHRQVPSGKMQMWKFRGNEIQGSDFDKAEFLFAVRHYDEALEHYNRIITSYTLKSGTLSQLEISLKRKLVIFVRAQQNPKAAVESFEKDLHNKQWSKNLKAEVGGWINALKKIIPASEAAVSAEALEALASKAIPPLLTAQTQFQPGSYVTFLYVSGQIYEFINTHKQKEVTPGLLYWLAICDIRLSQNFYFSLADLYLKECIKRFPTSKVAEKCYSELESITVDSYTGSSGVHLPSDIKDELKKYKSMLTQGI